MKLKVKKQSNLFEFLSEHYPDSSRSKVKKLLQSGKVRINDTSVTQHSYTLKEGDVVEIIALTGRSAAPSLPFRVLYEDNDLIVIDKPPGYPTSSSDGSRSIFAMVSDTLRQTTKGKVSAYIVHRLDKEVSGVLLFTKSAGAMNILKDNWGLTEKHYYALVEGVPGKTEDTLKSWLSEDNKQKVRSVKRSEKAKLAITHYKILQTLEDHALLEITTETGRKNQIRVHLSEMGHPIIGDRKYGASAEYLRRIRLHAYSLSFFHPRSGKKITVKSEMPAGFLTLKPGDEHYK